MHAKKVGTHVHSVTMSVTSASITTTSETTAAFTSQTAPTTSTIVPNILGYPLESATLGLVLIVVCGVIVAIFMMGRILA